MRSIALPWRRESLRIALCPDRVVVARVVCGLRTRVVEKRELRIGCPHSNPLWSGALAVLPEALQSGAQRGLPVTMILSNHFARFATLQWRDKVTGAAERDALARQLFGSIYGGSCADWDIRVSDDGFGRNALACAVDRELLRGLDEVFAGCRHRLQSVEPYFMTLGNRFRDELRYCDSGCLAVVESGRTTLALFDRRGWQAVTVMHMAGFDPYALISLVARKHASAMRSVPSSYLFLAALEQPRFECAGLEAEVRVLRLKSCRGFSPLNDGLYAIALCGVA